MGVISKRKKERKKDKKKRKKASTELKLESYHATSTLNVGEEPWYLTYFSELLATSFNKYKTRL